MPNQNNKTGINSDEDESEDISCDQPPSSVSNRTTSELETERVTFAAAQAAFEKRIRKKLMPSKKQQKSSNTSASPPQNTTDEPPHDAAIATSETINQPSGAQPSADIEQIDDNDGPEPPAAMLEESLNTADTDIANKTSAAISNNLESINQLSPPVPFNYAQFQAATANIPDDKTDLINQLSPPTPFHPHNVPDNKVVNINQLSPPVPFNYAQFQAATDNIPDNKSDLINQLAPPTPFHPHNVPDNKVVDINQLSPPVPFNFTEYERKEEDDVIKMNAKALTNQTPVAVSNDNDSSHVEPIQNVRSNHLLPITASEQSEIDPPPPPSVSGNHNQVPDIIRRPPPPSMLLDPHRVSDPSNITSEPVLETAMVENATAQGVVDASVENNETSILEAYAVDDDIYGATPLEPTLPWWKQRRTKILLGVVLVIVTTLAIVLGVELSKDDAPDTIVNMIVNGTDAPSVSSAPSSSMVPSASPTECVNKIISNAQETDLKNDLQINDPHMPKVAVDGRNMAVVALDGKYYTTADKSFWGQYDGPAFITFYLLDNNNEWQRVQTPIRVDDLASNGGFMYSVALSGSTAFIGFQDANDGAGDVLEYKQNDFNEWERVDDPFVHTTNTTLWFGDGVDIDGDLACVGDLDNVYIYHQDDESKWIQFDTIKNSSDCFISGDTIAVSNWELFSASIKLYNYNQDQNKVSPIQDPIPVEFVHSMDLSKDYLVTYKTNGDNTIYLSIYHQSGINQTFAFYQQLKFTGSLEDSLYSLALDNDMLVVRGYNHTHIYSLQDGDWVESITIDESYDDIEISGRTLLATKNNETSLSSKIYSFNIQDCTQDMPTQSPTLSSSSAPSVSASPTSTSTCFDADDGGFEGVLHYAVRAYVDQDCANNKDCEIGQTYGWPMNLWCVGSVKSMSGLFSEMDTFNEDINGWNTSSVTDMYGMFMFASSFDGDVSNFDTLSVTDMAEMFGYATSFNGDVSSFDTSSVTDMAYMFASAKSFNGNVSNFNTSSVTDMTGMFGYARSFNGDLSSFDTSSVTDMSQMFEGATVFNGDLSNFDTSKVTSMWLMFSGASSFNGDVSNFDTSSVTDMSNMFASDGASSFNADVSSFDTSSVTDMSYMFAGATAFNGDLSNFDTSGVTRMHGMFSGATSFNGDVSNFDTSSVTSMQLMFSGASSFNGDVSNFDTSSVTDMPTMFLYAISFNQDVSNFNTSSVTDMSYMFYGATAFSQDLCSWQDSFPYTKADDVFLDSGCTYQDTPQKARKGPFCASDCQSLSVSTTSSTPPPPAAAPTASDSQKQEDDECIDTPNYLDMYNGGCDLYELPGNEAWCGAYGNDGEVGMTPNENCCVCKGKSS